jgi:receptor-binding and translocation channel-forming TcA subunit of Tc toxin/ABC toxin-like protein/neuraminidase-like protein/virulence plasmid A protein
MADKTFKTFRITGRVIDLKSQDGIAGLRVEAWDKELIFHDLVGSAITDEQGSFRIEFPESHFKELFRDQRPDLFFKVFREKELIKSTEGSVLWNVAAGDTGVVIEVGLPAAGRPEETFVVRGKIRGADGSLLIGMVVKAFDKDLRSEELLGEAATNKAGEYEIRYSDQKFCRAEKGNADLVIRVFSPDSASDRDRPLVESPTLFNAPAVAEIDLQVPDTGIKRSEFERHVEAIAPLLVGQAEDGGDLPIVTLTERDIDFLASDTGIERQHVAWLSTAFAHSAKTASIRIASHLSSSPPQVPAALFYGWFREGLSDQWEQLIEQSIGTLRTAARAAIAHEIIPAELEANIEATLDAMPNPRRDALRAAVTVAGLGQEALGTILQHAGAVAEVNNPLVFRLVDEGKIASADAHRMGLGLAAHELVDGHEATMAAIVSVKPARLGGRALQRARDLAALDVPDIEKALGDANIEPPAGITLASYATRLAGQIAEVFPTDALLHRATNVSDEVVSAVERVVAGHAQSDLQLRAFINLHPGLGLGKVVDEATDAATAVSTIKKRVAWVDRLRELNPDLDLFAIDYLPESESLKQVKFDGLSDDARSMVIANLKAYQRVQSVGAGALGGIELLKAGYRSATAVARSLPAEIAEQTGLPVAEVRAYHAQAERKATDAALTWFAFHDLERDARTIKHRAFLDPPAYLKQLTGYKELFGSPNFCHCEHCQSVLGAAAYFVDLMYFVECHILRDSFKAHGGEQHSLHLRRRRPDLWSELELTCDNTNKVVPSLDLVIDLLEKFIVKEKGLASVAQLHKLLAKVDHSIRLPFSLPLERLSILLSHLGISRSEIGRAFLLRDSDAPVRARIRLGMLPKQFQIITTSRLGDLSAPAIRAAEQFFSLWLNANPGFSTIPGETETRILNPIGHRFDVLLFTRASGSDRAIVSTVFVTDFVNGAAAGAPARIRLEAGIATAGGVQNDTELVRNLTAGRLDRFERFVRLWRHVPWTIAELDYVIGRLQNRVVPTAAGENRVDEGMVVALAQLLDVQDPLQVPVDELCALWDSVPPIALRGDTSLFDRVFNLPPFVRQQGPWPNDQLINATSGIRARLVAALQLNDQDLSLLKDGLDACLGRIDTDAQGNRTFVQGLWLNERNLSLLYRHARLARLLKLSIEELLQTMALTASLASKAANERCVLSLTDLRAILDLHGWRATSGFRLPEALFITKAVSALAGYDSPDVFAARIAAEVAAEKSLHISLDLFTQIGLTQPESAKLIAENSLPVGGNPPLLEQVPGDESSRISRAIGIEDVAATFLFDPEPRAALIAEVARDVYRIVKRGGDAGFEPAALMELGLSGAEAVALVDANLSSAANDGKPFERVPGSTTHYRLRAAVSEAAAIAGFGTNPQDFAATKIILRHRAVDLVLGHHAETVLAAKASTAVKVSPEKTRALLNLAMPSAPAERQSLVDALQGGPLQSLSTVLDRLIRYAVLFRNAAYHPQALEFVRANPAVLALSDPPTAETIRRVSRYSSLAAAPDPAFEPDAPKTDMTALQSVLTWTDSIANATTDTRWTQLALALRTDVPYLQASKTITGATWATGTATYTSAAHGYVVGDVVKIASITPSGYNVAAGLVTAATTSTFGVAVTSDPGAYTSGGTSQRFEEEVKGVLSQMALAGGGAVAPRVDELSQLKRAVTLTHRLGVASEILRLAVSEDFAQLARSAEGVFAAIRAKYPDEKAFREKLEPFEDKLRSRARDGLVEYLLSAPDDATTDWRKRFASANDLYYYFLTDVMVEGCARTSKVVAAVSSVQLYVHRVLMNLEQSDGSPVVAAHFDNAQRQEEWRWRKNYQVWVANRKVFLYPENYIEPGLRDDKTPLFKELEDTLLQQQITEQNVLDAYAQYLHGFEEVARLRIAGAYHDRHGSSGDLLHLFGVTASEPPVYYYRTIRNIEETSKEVQKNNAGPVFSAWEKVDLQIPVRNVSPIVFLGRLYVFWVETTTRQLSEIKKGNSEFIGYRHSVRTKFSQLRLDGKWTPPQIVKVPCTDPTAVADVRLIDDPLMFMRVELKNGTTHYLRVDNDFDHDRYRQWAAAGLVLRVSVPYIALWDTHNRQHLPPLEEYSPEGWQWKRVYPNVRGSAGQFHITFKFSARSERARALPETVDLWNATARLDPTPGGQQTFQGVTVVEPQAGGAVRLFQMYVRDDGEGLPFYFATDSLNDDSLFSQQGLIQVEGPLVWLPPRSELQVLNGNTSSVLMEPPGESLLLLAKADWSGFDLRNLGTSLAQSLGTKLTADRIAGLLETEFQESEPMKERASTASIVSATANVTPRGFSTSTTRAEWTERDSALRSYFREVFFQIPFLIADHLNSQQKFADAQRWYHYLYDPTASEPGADEKTRPWRYREFRQAQKIQKLRDALTDPDALAAYRQDPFNPHAIARLRPGAYQKSIFMKYIDNLLDWGDSLFSQFTMESVNEATMLYVMAADILGPRPTELGPCGETSAEPKTYERIAPLLRAAVDKADFLIEEFEVFTIGWIGVTAYQPFIYQASEGLTKSQAATVRSLAGGMAPPGGSSNPAGWNKVGAQTWKEKAGTALADLYSGNPIGGAVIPALGGQAAPQLPLSGDPVGPPDPLLGGSVQSLQDSKVGPLGAPKGLDPADYILDVKYGLDDVPPPKQFPPDKAPPQVKPFELAHSRLVFCFPENKELRGYWDRVEDRLNKIRNCMDITGVRRRLELFAPEIDPRMLVRMRAAGLSLDDVMNVTSGNLPPYRFTYLIEKAKQHAGIVQNFGSQLLSALEKRDGEELTRLRTVHEQNLLKLRSNMTQWEIDAAEDTLESLRRQRTAAEYRRDHFGTLMQTGLTSWERVQQVSTHAAGGALEAASGFALLAAGLKLIPQLGAPTSMKYGGEELSGAAWFGAGLSKLTADFAERVGKSAGLEATFQRRDEDWKHQVELAKKEMDQLAKQITAAEIRRDIAIESQKVYDRSVEQVQEIFDFLRDRFTNFGRFTWLSAELQKLHRMAFNAALSVARLAEQACHFEHPDEAVKPGLAGDYWDAGNAGLLAGDRLTLDLHNLERRYIETHHRTLEIEQSFSLARFDPDALSKLKTECVCDFEIPEWFFDLTYPGHYRRRIKAVRLTIPCVVGPHTNVGATLRLNGSHIRKEPQLESPVPVPLRHLSAIAASMGQSDAGVFEFSFRDERYMPFEGAGVNSQWQLSLPKAVKPFDYATISDVILRISYTAEENSELRQAVEGANGVLLKLTEPGVTRVLSMRNDFPDAWNALLEGAPQVAIDIRDVHIPFFMSAFDLESATFDLLVQKLADQDAIYPSVEFDDGATTGSGADIDSGLYKLGTTKAVSVVSNHVIKITDLGSVSVEGVGGGPRRLDGSKLKDIMLRVVLRTTASDP